MIDLKSKQVLKEIEDLASKGYSELLIAKTLGISYNVLLIAKAQEPEVANALKMGVAKRTTDLGNALYKSAMGYYKTEVKTIEVRDKDTDELIEIRREKIKKWYKPSEKLLVFYLTNKNAEEWTATEVQQAEKLVGNSEHLSPEELLEKLETLKTER